jgi:phage-related protein
MADERNYIGIAFGADVSDLKSGLELANKQISNATKSFEKNTVGMKNWQKSIEGVEAKVNQLSDILVSQNQKLAGLKAEYKKVADEQGASSEAALKLQQQIKRQQAIVNQTQKEFLNYSDTLDKAKKGQIDLENVSLKAGKAVKDFGEKEEEAATAANKLRQVVKNQEKTLEDLEEQYLNTSLEQGKGSKAARALKKEIDKLNDELNENKSKLGEVDDATAEAGDGFTVLKGSIATFVGNGLTALVNWGSNAMQTILGLSESTRDYRRTLATLDTASNDAGVNADKMRDKFTDLMGVFNDEDSVTEGLNNLLAAGFDEKNIDAITEQLEGAALKFKDTLKFEGVSDGLQETLATGKAIGPFAELLERSGVNLETFDEGLGKATTSAEKQNYILQELSKLGLADVSKNFREQNAEMIEAEKANVDYQNSVAGLGEKVEPITTKIREGFTKILDKVLELASGADLEGFGEKIETAFDGFINDVIPKIVDGLQWIIDNKDILIAGIAGIGVAMATMNVANMIMGVVKAFQKFKKAQEGATIAQWLLNVAMNANPVGLIVAAIAGLVAAFVILWNKSDAFRNFFIGMWDGIKNAVGVVVDWIKENWQSLLLFLVNPVAGVFKYLYDNFDGFRKFVDGVVKSVKEFFSEMWSKLKSGAVDAWNGIKSVFSKVGSFFSTTFSNAWQKVKDIFSTGGKIFDGIKDGIVTAFKDIVNRLIRGINKVVSVPFNALNKVLDKIREVEIAGFSPFKGLISEISVPEIPELEYGGVLKKGQIGLLEGKGAEAVVPLEKNLGWIKKIAEELSRSLDISGIKGNAAALAYGGASGGTTSNINRNTVINAGMTVNYNGNLSRKELKRIQNDNYTAILTKLKKEGEL